MSTCDQPHPVDPTVAARRYVPSANIGELSYAVANVTAEAAKLPAEQRAIDNLNTTKIWTDAW